MTGWAFSDVIPTSLPHPGRKRSTSYVRQEWMVRAHCDFLTFHAAAASTFCLEKETPYRTVY